MFTDSAAVVAPVRVTVNVPGSSPTSDAFGSVATTVTTGSAAATTVTVAVPLTPPEVAVIVVDPAATGVTAAVAPVPDTVATPALLLLHVTVGDVTGPTVFTTDAVNVPAAPPTPRFKTWGAMVTETTVIAANAALTLRAWSIVTAHDPVPVHAPPQPANVLLDPGAAVSDTAAPAANDALHVPVLGVEHAIPAGVDVTDPVPVPDSETLSVCVTTVGGTTVIDTEPDFPSLVAVIVTVPPAVTPAMRPSPETTATKVLLDVHATERPVSVLLLASRTIAVACIVVPATIDVPDVDTVTDATEAAAGGLVVGGEVVPSPPQNERPNMATSALIARHFI